MGEVTNIAWTDSTFNPWIGCTKVGPGCDNCYAEALMDKRFGRVAWGAGKPRQRTSAANWGKVKRWNAEHDSFYAEHGRRRRVFCASLADVFDNEVPAEWREDLYRLIRDTTNLDWLVLTKRIGNVPRMLPACGELPENVWLGITVVNQHEADRDIPRLEAVDARIRFLSVEPMLGPINILGSQCIDWVIAGGESGPEARPVREEWLVSLRDQCRRAGIPFFFKQWGGATPTEGGCLLEGQEWKRWPKR